jgi:hypothetical protein
VRVLALTLVGNVGRTGIATLVLAAFPCGDEPSTLPHGRLSGILMAGPRGGQIA